MNTNIIVLEWIDLAKPIDITFSKFILNPDNNIYNRAAHNAIDVGEYVGQCLAALWHQTPGNGPHIHLVGASLGAHLVGTAGRTFHQVIIITICNCIPL